jgi:hypothetical protein
VTVLVVGFLLRDRLDGWWTLRVGIPLGGFGGAGARLFGPVDCRSLGAAREDSIGTPSGLEGRQKALSQVFESWIHCCSPLPLSLSGFEC